MTQISPADRELLLRERASVVHCPSSNLKLASGFCPTRDLLAAGVNVCIGTDGAASNNTLDMFAEARLAALVAKGGSGDPTALSAHAALRLATLAGAEALGLGDRIGSLLPGKDADMIAVDLDRLGCQPVYDVHSALVYTAGAHAVTHNWVEGRLLVEEGQLLQQDESSLLAAARDWRVRIHGSTRGAH
jgi:5-methylthioadenosine/S-adenosylhomocysteine deaminase